MFCTVFNNSELRNVFIKPYSPIYNIDLDIHIIHNFNRPEINWFHTLLNIDIWRQVIAQWPVFIKPVPFLKTDFE